MYGRVVLGGGYMNLILFPIHSHAWQVSKLNASQVCHITYTHNNGDARKLTLVKTIYSTPLPLLGEAQATGTPQAPLAVSLIHYKWRRYLYTVPS